MITKDNVKEYQIKCYDYNTYEDRMKVISILESFGQEVYHLTSFKDKYFIKDTSATFHIDGNSTWYYTIIKNNLKTVSVSEFIKLATPKAQEISLTDIFKYKKTGTLYKVKYADYYYNEFTLATLSTNKTDSWCQNMTYSRLMELFEPVQVTTTPNKTKPSEPDVTTTLVSKEEIGITSAGTSLYIAPTTDRAPSVTLGSTSGVAPNSIPASELSSTKSIDKTINSTQQKEKKKMAPKIKETASALVADNKEALVNAAELKAGQLINKQVMKLATPRVPLLLQGYMKHPAMQILVANAVGFGLKHYAPENKKLQKLSKLMLNAAAFDTVDSFNLDEMIENILSGIKLPAGVSLDDNDEE